MLAVSFIFQLMLVIKSILAVETSLFYDAKKIVQDIQENEAWTKKGIR